METKKKLAKFYIVGFLLLMGFDTFAQISFKNASAVVEPFIINVDFFARILSNVWVYGAIAGYIGAFIVWMTLLKYAPVGASFAASHLEIVSVTIVSYYLFNEPLNNYKIIGGVLIVLGVLCLAKSEQNNEQNAIVKNDIKN